MPQEDVFSSVLSVPRHPFHKKLSGHSVQEKVPGWAQTANLPLSGAYGNKLMGGDIPMALWEWEGTDKLQPSITEKHNYHWAATCWSHCFTSPLAFWTGGRVKWFSVTHKCADTPALHLPLKNCTPEPPVLQMIALLLCCFPPPCPDMNFVLFCCPLTISLNNWVIGSFVDHWKPFFVQFISQIAQILIFSHQL